MVCLDSPGNVAAKATLRIRDANTGQVLQEHVLGFPVSDTAELTPDGEWVLLRRPYSDPVHQLLVTSIRTGQQRCLPVTDESHPRGKMSPDGRYKAVYPLYFTNQMGMGSIADLSTGKSLYPADQQVEFSPDNLRWVGIDTSGSKDSFVFHALDDGREIGRAPVPEIPDMSRLLLQRWTSERLEFIAIIANGPVQNARRYSLRVHGTELTDLQAEPLLSHYSPVDKSIWWEKGDNWAFQVSPANWGSRGLSESGGILNWLTLKLLRNPRTRRLVEGHYRWQPISPTTGEPIGRGIVVVEGDQGFNIPMKLAADGRWLAEAGDRLRVWQVPAPERYQRKLWTLVVAVLPWLLLLRRRRGLSGKGVEQLPI